MQVILGTMTFSDQVDRDTAAQMIGEFKAAGHHELDTAYVYNKGNTELLLGELNRTGVLDDTYLAGKVNPRNEAGLTPEVVDRQLSTSLERLGKDSLDLFYLHMPDLHTPIATTLEAVFRHYQAGRFRHFGLSNYAAWQVAEIVELCRHNGWMEPIVYQGMYNALTRDVERELLPCLKNYGIKFYAYNPLAGGLLSGKYRSVNEKPQAGRFATFDEYPARYWKADYFSVIDTIAEACRSENIAPAAAAIRWLIHHSKLADDPTGHGVILGASSLAHLRQNLTACEEGPLPAAIVEALDAGWEEVRPSCIKYFRP
ncbi:MAG: aldo/keto reductase [Gammaproteobacteria bacterium]|nr:aldo/keto reductase [Gammaproteobacteria bacterium]